MSDQTSSKSAARLLPPLLWAVFLGCSWTWVIGMFLPVLLVRDYGAWAWVVFAVPNVLGAAAMGWVLRDAAASERFVQRHETACRAFSLVTVSFHVFFAMWLIQRITGLGAAAVVLALFMLGILAVGRRIRRRPQDEPRPEGGPVVRWVGALAVTALSFLLWNMLYGQGALALPPVDPLGGREPGLALAYIAPVFLFGFALNPYLDLTFHRVRRSTSPAGGRVAFGVGFGVVFLSMIVFTLLYARFLRPAVDGQPLSTVMSIYLAIHLIAQSAFTMAAHVSELPPIRRRPDTDPASTLVTVGGAVFVIASALVGWYASTPRQFRGHDLGEVIYWCFLGFYGLVFPGYVWLCATPRTSLARRQFRRAMTVLAGVVVIAFPMFWMAFIEGRHAWLVPGLLVLVLSKSLVPNAARAD